MDHSAPPTADGAPSDSGTAPVPGAVRRAWVLLRDPFATPFKVLRTLLLLAWLGWFPPRQFGGGALLAWIPICSGAAGLVFGWYSLRNRRRAAREPEEVLRGELVRAIAEFEGMAVIMQVMIVALVLILGALLGQAALRAAFPSQNEFAIFSMGILILWGSIEMRLHHRRAARLVRWEQEKR